MDKAAEAFRTISEVAEEIGIAKHVLRFWEVKFGHIRPMKRGGGRRYYRPEDLELLKGIRHLLHRDGYTIKGVQKILREQGLEAVKAFGRDDDRARGAAPQSAPVTEMPSKPSSRAIKTNHAQSAVANAHEAAPARGRTALSDSDIRALISTLEECRTILTGTAARSAT